MKKKKKKKGLTKGEKFIYRSSFIIIFLLVVGIIFTSISVSKLNIELQKMSSKVNKQVDINESLVMKINEIISLDNIKNISKDLGLSYNNDNVKIVE